MPRPMLRLESIRLKKFSKDGSENPPFMMRQTDYLEKRDGEWKVLHEHTSATAKLTNKLFLKETLP